MQVNNNHLKTPYQPVFPGPLTPPAGGANANAPTSGSFGGMNLALMQQLLGGMPSGAGGAGAGTASMFGLSATLADTRSPKERVQVELEGRSHPPLKMSAD
jgi:hypothetical protein